MTSQEFRAIRSQLGLTQAELAEIMGMPKQSVSRIERGERQPTKIIAAFMRYIEATGRIKLCMGSAQKCSTAEKFQSVE